MSAVEEAESRQDLRHLQTSDADTVTELLEGNNQTIGDVIHESLMGEQHDIRPLNVQRSTFYVCMLSVNETIVIFLLLSSPVLSSHPSFHSASSWLKPESKEAGRFIGHVTQPDLVVGG